MRTAKYFCKNNIWFRWECDRGEKYFAVDKTHNKQNLRRAFFMCTAKYFRKNNIWFWWEGGRGGKHFAVRGG
jgi:hypothetical protein